MATFEKDGIVYFNPPMFVADTTKWVLDHLDCDTLITSESLELEDDNTAYVRCYAKDRKYNAKLRFKVMQSELKEEDLAVLSCLSSEEVGRIDQIYLLKGTK